MNLLEAIAHMEGFYVQGSLPNRNNNPGDIENGKFALGHGAVASKGRFAVFPDAATGFSALRALLETSGYNSLTIAEAINRYAPPVENQTNHYINVVCNWVGCNASDLVKSVLEKV